MKMKEKIFSQVTHAGYVKNSLKMKKLEIVVTYYITGKFRGEAHWSCNKNLQLTKKISVVFHSLGGYGSHLNFYELKKFDEKIYAIPNRLEKYMAFILNKNIVFIDSMQFMNSSLEKLVENLVR